ncbi:hypothetical protein AB0284_04475 [Pseudarthrobacter phenanthrenivorans]
MEKTLPPERAAELVKRRQRCTENLLARNYGISRELSPSICATPS